MSVLAGLTVLALALSILPALIKTYSSDSKDLLKAFTGGVLIYYIGSTLADLVNGARNLIFNTGQGAIFVGNTILFCVAIFTGLIAGPLFVIFVLKQKNVPYLMAMAFGLINLSFAFALNEDLSSGVLALGAVTIVLLVIRYILEGLALSSSTFDDEFEIRDFYVILAIVALPAVLGLFFASPSATTFVNPFIQSLAVGLFVYALPRFIFDSSTGQKQYRFLLLIAGMSVASIVEIAAALIGR
jgi:ABC-type glucose/galactose transport system permease subunit